MGIVFSDAWADDHSTRESDDATHRVNHTRASEVHRSMTQAPVNPSLREPTAPPDPVRVQAVRQRNPEAVKNEILPRPPLSHRTRGDRRRGVHEDHHEEKQHHHGDVISNARKEPTGCANNAIGECARSFSRRINYCTQPPTPVQHRKSGTERSKPTRRNRTIPPVAPADGKAVKPKPETAEWVDHKIHRRGMRSVFRPAQAGFDQHETRLHEHDQKTSN